MLQNDASSPDGEQAAQWAPLPRREPVYTAVIAVLRVVVALLFRLRVEGRLPAHRPLLIACNHVSFLDPVTLAVTMERQGHRGRFLVIAGIYDIPLLRWAMRRVRFIRVDPRRSRASLDTARAALGAGETVVLYPEGHVAPGDVDLPAMPGVGWLALQTGVPVVPVAQWGMQRERGHLRWARRRRASVIIGDPVQPSGPDGRSAAEEVLAAIRSLLPRARALTEARNAALP